LVESKGAFLSERADGRADLDARAKFDCSDGVLPIVGQPIMKYSARFTAKRIHCHPFSAGEGGEK
jgi:hypothetical protein